MRVGFIGTGNMGGAILKGYAQSDASLGKELFICNRTDERNRCMSEDVARAGREAVVCGSPKELADKADVIIIGVKPAGVPEILAEISPAVEKSKEHEDDKLIISMAAGVSLKSMESALKQGAEADCSAGTEARLMRIMPNTPAQVGEAMTSISRNSNVSDEELAAAKAIFDSVGLCEEVPEDMIDCVIGVSGSSPAYTYLYMQALVEAAVENGMEKEKARAFAAQAVIGAAKMALESDESLEQLRVNVCSPGGTTIEGVNTLFDKGFVDDVKECFQAVVDKSKSMTSEK